MSTSKEGVNPLRPYYIPPTISDDPLPSAASTAGSTPHGFGNATATGKYASRARDMFSDLDYKDYEPSPSALQSMKALVDELMWKYMSVLMAQPFEVAKTILQVRSGQDAQSIVAATSAAAEKGGPAGTPLGTPLDDISRRRKASQGTLSLYDDLPESDSDPDEPAYFTSNVPSTPTPLYPRSRSHQTSPPRVSRTSSSSAVPSWPSHQLVLRNADSVLEVVSQVWQREGAWGVWKGSNATFVYSVLQSLLENWSRSLLSALFNVPDLGVQHDLDRVIDIASPYPWASLFVAGAAAVATGLILAPLDLVRTRLIITPTSRAPRRSLSALRTLPSYICAPSLLIPTVLHSLVHPLLTLSTPLVLRTRFMIDRELSPATFSFAKFASSTAALFVKLPLETVLRRGQVAVLASPAYVRAASAAAKGESPSSSARRLAAISETQQLETIVPAGGFGGVIGTMQTIMSQEGSRPVSSKGGKTAPGKKGKARVAETVYRKGQGVEGLWRGWKVSWWGLVGLWAAGVIGGGGDGEF